MSDAEKKPVVGDAGYSYAFNGCCQFPRGSGKGEKGWDFCPNPLKGNKVYCTEHEILCNPNSAAAVAAEKEARMAA